MDCIRREYLINPLLERRLLRSDVPLSGNPFQMVVAIAADTPIILRYLEAEFYKRAPLAMELRNPQNEIDVLLAQFPIADIAAGRVILALDGQNICGLLSVETVKVEDEAPRIPVRLEPREFREAIDELSRTRPLRVAFINASCRYVGSLTASLLPADCKEYFVFGFLSVHHEYRKRGIGEQLWRIGAEFGRKLGLCVAQSICTAAASTRIAEKCGMQKALKYPLTSFLYNGTALFPRPLADGMTTMNVMIGELEKMK